MELWMLWRRYEYYAVTDHAPNLVMQRMTDAPRAGLTAPVAVGWHAVAQANIHPGDVPLVIGGPRR
jgi:threonine dehydrogenase-like Zn-dependent dehydrogenase